MPVNLGRLCRREYHPMAGLGRCPHNGECKRGRLKWCFDLDQLETSALVGPLYVRRHVGSHIYRAPSLSSLILASGASGEVLLPPDEVMQFPSFVAKRAMEFAHLQHFKRMVKSQLPHLQFRLVGDGAEPPDFVLSRDNSHFGLELTVFATPQRRERAAFFSKLHDRLMLAHSKGRLRGLSGMKVDLAFGDLGVKPFAVNDASVVS